MPSFSIHDQHPLKEHPLFREGHSVGLMSGEKPLYPNVNEGGHVGLKSRLNEMGLKYEETHGRYGNPEQSLIIRNPTHQQMFQLGKEFGQESVIHGEGNKHKLLYTNGPNEGMFHPSTGAFDFGTEPPKDMYTAVPGKGFLSLNFDWSKLYPSEFTPQKGSEVTDYQPSEAKILHGIQESKKLRRIEPYLQMTRNLEPQEIKKGLMKVLSSYLFRDTTTIY